MSMTYPLRLFTAAAIILAAAGMPARPILARDPVVPDGFIALFNGRDLSGWKGLVGTPVTRAAMTAAERAEAQKQADARMKAHWSVVDGVLVFDGRGDNLCTEKEYGDFELYVDWKIAPGGDSGIYLRSSPQVQIWDPDYEPYFRHGAENGSGAFWNNQQHPRFPLVRADRPVGEWNTFRIQMIGERATVWLNGQLVVDDVVMENVWDRRLPIAPRGSIELQNHGSRLFFRNLFLREIGPEEANRILAERSGRDGFVSLFNGRDLEGWTGASDDFEAADGTIVCRPGRTGTLLTEQTYSDFIVQMEFRLPPGGRSGLIVRCSDSGQDGLEIPILDSLDPRYRNLDPDQQPGSVSGLAAAHQGYLRPAGQWNFQQVMVRGSRFRVELNGTTVLDADLAQIAESRGGSLPSGVRSAAGRIGIAGYGDTAAFRRMAVRELPGPPAEPPERETAVRPVDGPIRLFNGRNLEGFYTWIRDRAYADPDRVFTVEDGMIHVSGQGYGGLITQQAYRDYHLVIEFRWGQKTWGNREGRARDSGILLHCWGPDGGYAGTWMASIEAQIIEGGVGDLLVLTGSDPLTGRAYPSSVTAEITKDRDGEKVWHRGGQRVTISGGRINWFGRDPDWADVAGFRGRDDVESPLGEWTRMDVIAEGDHLIYKVNGVVVNEAFDVSPDAGRLLLQTEQAELFVRRFELWPLDQPPAD